LTFVDCATRDELVLRALEAKSMAGDDAKPNPRYSYHGGE